MSWLTRIFDRLFLSKADRRMEAENEVLVQFMHMLTEGDRFDAYRYLLDNTVDGQTSELLQMYRRISTEQLAIKKRLHFVE